MPGAENMLTKLAGEIDSKRAFQESLIEGADKAGRDLSDTELELFQRATSEMEHLERQLTPMRDAVRIAADSRARTSEIQAALTAAGGRGKPQLPAVEYRSTGDYVFDLWRGFNGDDDARQRIEMANRVAAHQTTSDVPGLLPQTILAPLVNFVDFARPIITAIGTSDPGTGTWAYAKVTQHTAIAVQSAEKAELTSQEMTITKTAIDPASYGGYVNISRQAIQRTTPQILDMVVDDLAGQYAVVTENVVADALTSGASTGTNTAVTSSSDADAINAALWHLVGQVYTNIKGQGQLFLAVSPDLLGVFGKAFLPVNPTNSASQGFNAGSFGSGLMGSIGGIPVVMSAGLNTNTALLISTAAVRILEHKYGPLQVAEPSVWGTQVGYAGDLATVIHDAGGVVLVDTTA